MTEPHPLDPDSKLNPEERVVFAAISGDSGWAWGDAVEATTVVTALHAIGAHVCVGRDCPHDTHRDPLPSEARARSGDPRTSEIAAASIGNMKERHLAVLQVAKTFADTFTYDELIHRYEKRREDDHLHRYGFVWDLPPMTGSSIRSRCKALQRGGWVEQAGRGTSDNGRPCNTWRVVR